MRKPFRHGVAPVISYNKTPVTNPKGLPTATKIRTLGTPLWTTVNYYDNKGRGIYASIDGTETIRGSSFSYYCWF